MMLFADLNEKGEIIIRAVSPLEKYALTKWAEENKDHANLNLRIETGSAISVEDLIKGLGSDIEAFQRWYRDQQHRAVLEDAPMEGASGKEHQDSLEASRGKCQMCGIILTADERIKCKVCLKRTK